MIENEISEHSGSSLEEIRRGWRIILGCAIGIGIGIMALPYSTAGLFIAALTEEFGWSRTQLSLGPTIILAVVALLAPVVGYLADRISSYVIITFSMGAVALAFGLLSMMTSDIGDYYLACILMSVFGAGASTVVFARVVWANFQERRGLALGMVMTGNGVTAIFTPVILGQLIENYGWRAGYLALAATIVVGTPIILFLLRSAKGMKPSSAKAEVRREILTGATFAQAFRGYPFWAMGVAFFLGTLATTGMIVHLIPFLLDRGMELIFATTVASAIGIGLIVGRLLTGWLMDRFEASIVGGVMMAASAAGLAVLAFGGLEVAIIGSLAIGLCIGAELDVIGYLTGRHYGMRSYGSIYGALYALCAAGTAVSPILYGISSDASGSYTNGLLVGIGSLVLASILLLLLPRSSVEFSTVGTVSGQGVAQSH